MTKKSKLKYTRAVQTPSVESTTEPVQNASSSFAPDAGAAPNTAAIETSAPSENTQKETDDDKIKAASLLRAASRGSAKNMAGLEGLKLLAPEIPGFKLYWAKDVGNRLANMERKGYIFVSKDEIDTQEVFSTDEGDKVSQVGGTDSGNPFRLYLMKIPEEWFNEDAEQKETNRQIQESQIRSANVGSKGLSGSVMYNPNPHANHLNPPEAEGS